MDKGVDQLNRAVADIDQRQKRGEIHAVEAAAEFVSAIQAALPIMSDDEANRIVDNLALSQLEFVRQAKDLGIKFPGNDPSEPN
jgi:hypothetical protein